jgi:hypothetical protein
VVEQFGLGLTAAMREDGPAVSAILAGWGFARRAHHVQGRFGVGVAHRTTYPMPYASMTPVGVTYTPPGGFESEYQNPRSHQEPTPSLRGFGVSIFGGFCVMLNLLRTVLESQPGSVLR